MNKHNWEQQRSANQALVTMIQSMAAVFGAGEGLLTFNFHRIAVNDPKKKNNRPHKQVFYGEGGDSVAKNTAKLTKCPLIPVT